MHKATLNFFLSFVTNELPPSPQAVWEETLPGIGSFASAEGEEKYTLERRQRLYNWTDFMDTKVLFCKLCVWCVCVRTYAWMCASIMKLPGEPTYIHTFQSKNRSTSSSRPSPSFFSATIFFTLESFVFPGPLLPPSRSSHRIFNAIQVIRYKREQGKGF